MGSNAAIKDAVRRGLGASFVRRLKIHLENIDRPLVGASRLAQDRTCRDATHCLIEPRNRSQLGQDHGRIQSDRSQSIAMISSAVNLFMTTWYGCSTRPNDSP